jgi:hypothetical protein
VTQSLEGVAGPMMLMVWLKLIPAISMIIDNKKILFMICRFGRLNFFSQISTEFYADWRR